MSGYEITIAADVARVGARGGIACLDGRRERRIRNRPAQSAVAGGLHLAVPARLRQPHLDADVGVRRRSQPRGDAAKRGERLEDSGGRRVRCVGRRERARLNGLGGDQRPAGNGHLLEGLARDRAGGGNASRRTRSTERENGNNTGERSYPHVLLRTPV